MIAKTLWRLAFATALLLGSACQSANVDLNAERIATAERYLRGIYSSDTTVVDELAGDDIVITYPIFKSLFGKPAIRGRTAVKAFVNRFAKVWAEPRLEFHEAVCDGDRVVLLWSFRARNVGSVSPDQPATNEERSWGGITLFRFDRSGKIIAEVGEESEPGPAARLRGSQTE